jgi:hypothetical protein
MCNSLFVIDSQLVLRPDRMDVVDHVVCQDLAKLVEELATSGKPTLEESTMKKIKKI